MRTAPTATIDVVNTILECGENAMPLEATIETRAQLRADHALSRALDRALLEQAQARHCGLLEAQAILKKFELALEKFNAPPWFPALVLRNVSTPRGDRVLVQHGTSRRLVALGEDV